jgi:hypothetical protein
MKQTGLYWHVHHNILLEWCYNYNERVEAIKLRKPKNEIEPRLYFLKPVKSKLPQKLTKAWKAYGKAYEAHDKACEAYDKAREAHDKARKAYDKAWKARYKAWKACYKVYEAHKKDIEKLHQKECPDCVWDGEKMIWKKWKK